MRTRTFATTSLATLRTHGLYPIVHCLRRSSDMARVSGHLKGVVVLEETTRRPQLTAGRCCRSCEARRCPAGRSLRPQCCCGRRSAWPACAAQSPCTSERRRPSGHLPTRLISDILSTFHPGHGRNTSLRRPGNAVLDAIGCGVSAGGKRDVEGRSVCRALSALSAGMEFATSKKEARRRRWWAAAVAHRPRRRRSLRWAECC